MRSAASGERSGRHRSASRWTLDILSVILVVLGTGIFLAERLTKRRRRALGLLRRFEGRLDELGIDVEADALGNGLVGSGVVDGIDVKLAYDEPRRDRAHRELSLTKAVFRVDLRLPVAMPRGQRVVSLGLVEAMATTLGGQDLKLGLGYLDDRVRVISQDPARTRALLGDGKVLEYLDRCVRNIDLFLDLRGERLSCRVQGEDSVPVGVMLDLLLGLARSLVAAAEAPFRARAAALGLSVQGEPSAKRRVLVGDVDGVPVRVVIGPSQEGGEVETRVTASIDPPLAGGLRIRGRPPGQAPSGVGAGDPVLDSVVDVFADRIEDARRLLSREAVTGPLLEVLHASPRSVVHPRGVVLVEPGVLDEALEDRVRAAVALVAVLAPPGPRPG